MPKLSIEKSIIVNASIDKVYTIVRDFNQWSRWSPWLIVEPVANVNVSEDGKHYSWKGKVVGSGKMEINCDQKYEKIDYTLTFLRPWKSTSSVSFYFAEKDGGTEVRWTMDGSLPFFLFWMKKMMTAFIGMDYQRGLMMLKDYIEMGEVPSHMNFTSGIQYSGHKFIGIKTKCTVDEMGPKMSNDFEKLMKYAKEQNINASGNPFSIYHKYDMVKNRVVYTSGIPVDLIPEDLSKDFVTGEIPAMKIYEISHKGPYRHLGNAWSAGMMHGRSKLFKQNKKIDPFEVYENMPSEVDEKDLETRVCFPMKG